MLSFPCIVKFLQLENDFFILCEMTPAPQRNLADKIRSAAKLLPKCNTLDFPPKSADGDLRFGNESTTYLYGYSVFLVRGFTYS
jgi:hypothetical protein